MKDTGCWRCRTGNGKLCGRCIYDFHARLIPSCNAIVFPIRGIPQIANDPKINYRQLVEENRDSR